MTFIAVWSANAQDLPIIPKPVSEASTNEQYILHDGCTIAYTPANTEAARIAAILQTTLHHRTGLAMPVRGGSTTSGIQLELLPKSAIRADGYELSIDSGRVSLRAKTGAGLFYGIQTIQQLLKKHTSAYLPGCTISDYPRYGYRGFMLDASRHFQSVAFVKKILDVMAVLKFNTLHWHLTDDEGWRIESKKFPALNSIGSYRDTLNAKQRNGYYTAAEIRDVIRYAKERFIKVIPEVEMPGHSRAIMDTYPAMLCSTNPGGNTYCAGKSSNYAFLKAAFAEVVDLFGTDVIHVGGDERPKDIWEKCPDCKRMIASKGLANEDMLQNYLMKEICNDISKHGVKTIAWFENLKDGIPKNQIVEAWHPGEALEAARGGYYTINSDCLSAYFDYPNTAYEKKFKPTWMPILEVEKVYAFNPTPDSLKESEKKFILGSECALWTEIVFEDDVQYQLFPRILAFAEDVWTPVENKQYDHFSMRAAALKPYIGTLGFAYDNGEKIIDGKP